jgi:hypothetical protein
LTLKVIIALSNQSESSGGKEIWLLTISESTTPKPALLITAGLDGKSRAGTQIALKMI